MSSNEIREAYDKLVAKYIFILKKLGIINEKVYQSRVDINELQKLMDNIIDEVTMKFPN